MLGGQCERASTCLSLGLHQGALGSRAVAQDYRLGLGQEGCRQGEAESFGNVLSRNRGWWQDKLSLNYDLKIATRSQRVCGGAREQKVKD